jgi:DNA polymerase-4
LAPKPVSHLPGVGAVAAMALESAGYNTIGDLARADPKVLAKRFGAQGARLAAMARGEQSRGVNADPTRRSISAETTFATDLRGAEALEVRLAPLCDRVARQARAAGLVGQVVILKLRHADFTLISRRRTLDAPTQTARTLFTQSQAMMRAEIGRRAWRLIGVGLTGLTDAGDQALDLFVSPESRARRSEAAVDALRDRYGAKIVLNAREMGRLSHDETTK